MAIYIVQSLFLCSSELKEIGYMLFSLQLRCFSGQYRTGVWLSQILMTTRWQQRNREHTHFLPSFCTCPDCCRPDLVDVLPSISPMALHFAYLIPTTATCFYDVYLSYSIQMISSIIMQKFQFRQKSVILTAHLPVSQ